MTKTSFLLLLSLMTWGCANSQNTKATPTKEWPEGVVKIEAIADDYEGLASAVFAGGCFWCVEAVFERVKGVKEAISGYAGGEKPNPTYKEVSYGRTDYAEAVIVYYDENEISYQELLTAFFAGHDPTQLNRQGPDVGRQYRSAIFHANDAELEKAEARIKKLNQSGKYDKPIATTLEPLTDFYVAEGYHQEYYELNPSQPYVAGVSRPKVEKFMKAHPELLKPEYKK